MTDLFDFHAPSNHFGVLGNPVAHSQSPRIHQLFARQFGIKIEYDRIQVDAGGFAQAVSHFAAHGGTGLNVTLPYKVEAWKLCRRPGNHLSEPAQRAQAVNTLRFERGGAVFGDNTDGIGMVRDIERNLGVVIAGKNVLLLGAGGAVRGVLEPLLRRQPDGVTIANRTAPKARALAEQFGDTVAVVGCGDDQVGESVFDLIINGTAASLDGELPRLDPRCLGARSVVYDMMYARAPTVFMRWALAHGAGRVSDGLGMLVEQAAESFHLWHDKRPDTAPVLDALRDT